MKNEIVRRNIPTVISCKSVDELLQKLISQSIVYQIHHLLNTSFIKYIIFIKYIRLTKTQSKFTSGCLD